MRAETKKLMDARAALAKHVAVVVPTEDQATHSKLVAAYVAAAVREDRASRREPSVFERIFGPSMFSEGFR